MEPRLAGAATYSPPTFRQFTGRGKLGSDARLARSSSRLVGKSRPVVGQRSMNCPVGADNVMVETPHPGTQELCLHYRGSSKVQAENEPTRKKTRPAGRRAGREALSTTDYGIARARVQASLSAEGRGTQDSLPDGAYQLPTQEAGNKDGTCLRTVGLFRSNPLAF